MFRWNDYLKQAKALAQNLDEASHRTAISRAYYFALNTVKDVLKKHSRLKRIKDEGTHDQVINSLSRAGFPAESADLKDLKKARVRADYDSDPIPDSQKAAEDAIVDAEKITNALYTQVAAQKLQNKP